MQFSLGEPFGVAFEDFPVVMALGALFIDIVTGHEHRQPDFMGVMAVIAAGFCGVEAFCIFHRHRGVAITADRSRRGRAVTRMT